MSYNFNFFRDKNITNIHICDDNTNIDTFINNYNLNKIKIFDNTTKSSLIVDYNFENINNNNYFLWTNIPNNTNFENLEESEALHYTHSISIYNKLKEYCKIELVNLCYIDCSKYRKNTFIQNKILVIDNINSFDESNFIKYKKNIKYNKYIYTKNIPFNNLTPWEFCEISSNIICCLIILGNDNDIINLDTYNLINKLQLCDIPTISNKNIENTIRFNETDELINIINYNVKIVNNFHFDNFFTKKNINQIMIADYNQIYKSIKKNYCLHDTHIYKYLEKNYEIMDIVFFGYDNNIRNKLDTYKGKKYIVWSYENKSTIYDIINLDVVHICITENMDRLFTELNIKHQYNKINLFNCKIYDNYDVLNNYYPMLDEKSIVIYNPHDDIPDSEIKEKFDTLTTKYNIYMFHEIDNTIQINYFIDLSHYYDYKLAPLFNYKIYFSTIIYSNNLTETDNIKNFYDLEEIITKISV